MKRDSFPYSAKAVHIGTVRCGETCALRPKSNALRNKFQFVKLICDLLKTISHG